MMTRKVAKSLIVACAVGWSAFVMAQMSAPPLSGHVIDETGTLSSEQKATLEQTLTAFEARKGSQLAVLMVTSTAPETVEQFALRVAEKWKLGRKKVDDGIILVIVKDDRAVRIEVGYGLEGALTDLTSKRIINETILPRFKAQDFYGGITVGLGQIIRVVDGEPLPEPTRGAGGVQGNFQRYIPLVFILALVLGGLLRAALGKVPGALVTGSMVAVIAWFVVGTLSIALIAGVFTLFITLAGGGMGGLGMGGLGMGGLGMGGFYGGGRGSRGGGFSGGGGGFGGGGASGRW